MRTTQANDFQQSSHLLESTCFPEERYKKLSSNCSLNCYILDARLCQCHRPQHRCVSNSDRTLAPGQRGPKGTTATMTNASSCDYQVLVSPYCGPKPQLKGWFDLVPDAALWGTLVWHVPSQKWLFLAKQSLLSFQPTWCCRMMTFCK